MPAISAYASPARELWRVLRAKLSSWIFQPRGPEKGSVVLVQRRIFILPSRHGMIYSLALVLMLTGSVNYNLSLGFVLTFLLAGLGINSILHTFRNLTRLELSAGHAQSVFAGEAAHFPLTIRNPGTLHRYSIGITAGEGLPAYTDVAMQGAATIPVSVAATARGVLAPGRWTLFTTYPLGLCHAWAYYQPGVRCIVYPRPETDAVDFPLPESDAGAGIAHGSGSEDFAGLRSYHPGDSPRHIAWKAAARGQGLLTKQFSGRASTELWLSWDSLPASLDTERKLSRLARWVITAHASGVSFGLRLPAVELAPEPGDLQRERCLEALALHGSDTPA